MNRKALLAAASVAGLLLVGCGDGSNPMMDVVTPTDTPVGTDVPRTDVQMGTDVQRTDVQMGTDSGVPATLFQACTGNADCNTGTIRGLVCDTRYPGGLCTRTCMRDSQCGTGTCVGAPMGQCFPSCTVGGGECSVTQVCRQVSDTDPTLGACLPACYPSNPPAGAPACVTGTTCDPGGPVPGCQMTPRTGAANGRPCMADADCLGVCITELNDAGDPSGFLGGQCISLGRLPDPAMFMGGRPLPTGNCPTGSAILPASNMAGEGDLGVCVQSCTTNADCNMGRTPDAMGRTGYFCNLRLFNMDPQPTNGICDTIDCRAAPFATMPNGGCPEGTACQPNPMMTAQGRCVRNPTMP